MPSIGRDENGGGPDELLQISSVNAEILDVTGRVPLHPFPKPTRKGPRLYPPDKPAEWHVGYRLGADPASGGLPTARKPRRPPAVSSLLRIPAKVNAISEGNANGIPGRMRKVFGAQRRWLLDSVVSVRLRQGKTIRSAAEEHGPLAEKGARGKGRQPFSPPQHTEARSARSAPAEPRVINFRAVSRLRC